MSEALKEQPALDPIHYPASDGQPMSDDSKQYDWIVTIKENLDGALPDLVLANNLWYPVEGRPDIRRGPDVLVALGRPKGHRSSYLQWEEGGIAPQVVFEIWSPGNTLGDAVKKQRFYDDYGVEEYYLYDPHSGYLSGWQRRNGRLEEIPEMIGHTSPLLGIRFTAEGGDLRILHRDGTPFLTVAELRAAKKAAEDEKKAAEEAKKAAEEARKSAEQRAGEAEARVKALAERLRALGIDPDAA